jgi:hypothetical protein
MRPLVLSVYAGNDIDLLAVRVPTYAFLVFLGVACAAPSHGLPVGLLLTHIRLGCCMRRCCNVYSAARVAPHPWQLGAEAATYAVEAGLELAAFPCTVTGVWQALHVLRGVVRAVYVCCPGCCSVVHACSALVVAVVAALIVSDALAMCDYVVCSACPLHAVQPV